MPTARKVNLTKVFEPSDSIAFIVIALGLFVALFIDAMAVRLIGVCIAVLGGVALFMMVSPRLAQLPASRTPRPSESPSLISETKKEGQTTSTVFSRSEYQDAFGQPTVFGDSEAEVPFKDDNQIELFDTPAKSSKPVARPKPNPVTTMSAEPRFKNIDGGEFSDGDSGVRIVGVAKSSKPFQPARVVRTSKPIEIEETTPVPEPKSYTKTRREDPIKRVVPFEGDTTDNIVAPSTPLVPEGEDIALSDDVVIKTAKSTPSVPYTPTTTPKPEPSPQPTSQPPTNPIGLDTPAPPTELVREFTPPPTSATSTPVRKTPEIAVSVFIEDNEDELGTAEEPRKEFDYLLNRVLMVIRSATNARTAAFFWVNLDKQQLVLESKISEATDAFTDQRKMPLGKDAVSRIAREGRPEILTDISPAAERDLLPYYTKPAQTLSFVGVPVYYGGKVVGVLCADSLVEDAYTEITIGFFGQFTKLISGLVSSYTVKFDLLHAAHTLDAITAFRAAYAGAPQTREGIVQALFSTLMDSMLISTQGICLYNYEQNAWQVHDVQSVNQQYSTIIRGNIDVNNSTVGHCIVSATTIVSASAPGVTRVVQGEPQQDEGQFIAIPLVSATQNYGCLFIENLENMLTQQDIAIAEHLAEYAGQLLEHVRTFETLQAGSLLDPAYGILNRQGFEMRLREEFSRSIDTGLPLTVCLIKLDSSRAATQETIPTFFANVLKHVSNQVRDYDIVSKVNPHTIAVALINYKAQDAQIWTENIRRDIASSVITIDGKRLSSTVSIGVAQADIREDWADLYKNALSMLTKSESQGNKVSVFA